MIVIGATIQMIASGGFFIDSLSDAVAGLVMLAVMLGLGSIAGAFMVALALLIFGVPVALALGEKVRRGPGIFAAIAMALITITFLTIWLFDAGDPYSPAPMWEGIAIVAAFAVPAAFFYWRSVGYAFDELEAA